MRLTLLLLTWLLSSPLWAQGLGSSASSPFESSTAETEFLPVEEAYQLDGDFTPDGLRLFWQIADGYYLYKHRLDFTLTRDGDELASEAGIPAGIPRTDEFFGDVEVFYTSLDVPLATAVGGSALLEVRSQGCADAGLCYPPQKDYYRVDFDRGTLTATSAPPRKVTPTATARPAAPAATATAGTENPGLLLALALAFMGGAILNLMPCVFPVLSLKVLSFTNSPDHERRAQGWTYSAGVVVSFVVIAAILIGLQQAGSAVGWGFQLQSPHFVIGLAYLFVIMGLMLSGLVEIGGSWMGLGQGLASRGGHTGSFFTGVLATVVASPCTAPFMGTALGYAITQPPAIALLIFASLGAGMAAPLLLLSYSQALRQRMPKPGPWMETFKQVMAFPLYATAIWLVWVAGRQTGVDSMALILAGVLFLALGLWLWRYRPVGRWLGVASVVLAVALAVNAPGDAGQPREGKVLAAGQQPWSPAAMQDTLADGRPLFIDFTADWCITCIANERAVLNTNEISAAFEAAGITYMVADWTNYDPQIADFLKQHGRNGIPFYLLYSGKEGETPQILPQLLTRGIVLDAISAVQ